MTGPNHPGSRLLPTWARGLPGGPESPASGGYLRPQAWSKSVMARVKVVNEASDLVGLLSAVDTPVKRDVFVALTSGWESERTIESRFGMNGRQALSLFDKQELLDSR